MHLHLGQTEKPAIALHCWTTDHQMSFTETKLLFQYALWNEGLLRETLEIRLEHSVLN